MTTKNGPLSYRGLVAFFVEAGVLGKRLQIWKAKFGSLGGELEEHVSRRLTHVFATSLDRLKERFDERRLKKLRNLGVKFLTYHWLEDCLKAGHELPVAPYELYSQESNGCCELFNPGKEAQKFEVEEWSLDKEAVIQQKEGTDEDSNIQQIYNPPNVNEKLTVPLRRLKEIYKEGMGDLRRSFSYQKAASTLEKLPFEVQSVEQVKNLPNIGNSILDHIHEILATGKLAKLDHFSEDEQVKTVTLFGSVWGIGPATALKLYKTGHRTLEDLAKENSLTIPQRLGLKFYDDFQQRISRNEVKDMEEMIRKEAAAIQPEIVALCCGSYRRGNATVGDIDIVLTHPDGVSHKGVLPQLVQKLKDVHFLIDDLVVGYHEGVEQVDTYFGICENPHRSVHHRIDFKVYSAAQYPFGLIAWTGNDVLNRKLKIRADAKGYRLDDTGLYRTMQDNKRQKVANRNAGVPCKSEREVFEFLDYPWLEPAERNL